MVCCCGGVEDLGAGGGFEEGRTGSSSSMGWGVRPMAFEASGFPIMSEREREESLSS